MTSMALDNEHGSLRPSHQISILNESEAVDGEYSSFPEAIPSTAAPSWYMPSTKLLKANLVVLFRKLVNVIYSAFEKLNN